MHFAFIRFSSLGDVVLQSSLISWVKFQFPNSKITFITTEGFATLVEGHKHIDEVLTIKRLKGKQDIKQLKTLARKISNETNVDLIFDLHNTLRAKLLKIFCFRTPAVTVNKRSLLRKFLVLTKYDFLKDLKPHVERTIEDFSFLVKKDFQREEFQSFLVRETQRKNIGLTTLPWSFHSFEQSILENLNEDYIVISPVASFSTKRWPISYVNELLELFAKDQITSKYKIVIVAGPDDSYCSSIKNDLLESKNLLMNLQGKTSLEQSAKILANANLVITNDTGSAHIAESFGTPVVVTFGATSPSFGFRPHLKQSHYLYADISCSPCSETGSKECSLKELKCMNSINPMMVFEKIRSQLIGGDQ